MRRAPCVVRMDHSRGRLQCELKCSYGIRYHPSKLYQPTSPYPRARIVCPRNYKFELPKAIISRLRQSARLGLDLLLAAPELLRHIPLRILPTRMGRWD